VFHVTVAGILTPRLAQGAQIGLDFAAADFEQWAHQVFFFLLRKDAGQAQGPGPTQDPHQYRLSLIIERVRRGDLVGLTSTHKLEKPTVAQLAGGGLQARLGGACVRWCIAGAQVEFQLQAVRQGLDKLLVLIGLSAANAVMKMRDREHDAQLSAQLHENAQKRH